MYLIILADIKYLDLLHSWLTYINLVDKTLIHQIINELL